MLHTCAVTEHTGEGVLVLIDHCAPGLRNEGITARQSMIVADVVSPR